MLGLTGLRLYIGLGMVLVVAFLTATVVVLGDRVGERDREIVGLNKTIKERTGERDAQAEGVKKSNTQLLACNAQLEGMAADAKRDQADAFLTIEKEQARTDATERAIQALRRKANDAQAVDRPRAPSPLAVLSARWLRCRQDAGPAAAADACAGKVGLPTD